MTSEKHTFALYYPELSHTMQPGAVQVMVTDKLLCSRAISVLRLEIGDQVVLFDEQLQVRVTITHLDTKKNAMRCAVVYREAHKPLNPAITLYQCLTQKSAFEEIVYTATQMGVTRVVPVISAKVQRAWGGARERDRLMKMMIAAAEQSKQFIFPVIEEPIKFVDVPRLGRNIFFSTGGVPLLQTLNDVARVKSSDQINVLIGSEGGLTEQEEVLLKENGWMPCRLTPTILRAIDAVIVGLGSLRSVGE